MARWRSSLLYVGIRAHVLAFDRKTGVEQWRTKLPARFRSASPIVNVFCDAEGLFASCGGELFCLDPHTGALRWHEALKGLGTGVAIFASDLGSSPQTAAIAAEATARQASANAAG